MHDRAVFPLILRKTPAAAPRPRNGYLPNTRDEEALEALRHPAGPGEVEEAARSLRSLTRPRRVGTPAMGLLGGLAIGALVGLMAGAAGALAGAIVGTIIGLAAGFIYQEIQVSRERLDDRLDKEIGVTSGSLGEANPNAPPAQLGHFGAASVGGGSYNEGDRDRGSGPITNIDLEGAASD
jgi:predicted lipid-binding transport protein (Tim44 family)